MGLPFYNTGINPSIFAQRATSLRAGLEPFIARANSVFDTVSAHPFTQAGLTTYNSASQGAKTLFGSEARQLASQGLHAAQSTAMHAIPHIDPLRMAGGMLRHLF